MPLHTIFERKASQHDPRVRWHEIAELNARSKPDALRRCSVITPSPRVTIGYATSCVETAAGRLVLAWPSDRIDFNYYDRSGHLVEVV